MNCAPSGSFVLFATECLHPWCFGLESRFPVYPDICGNHARPSTSSSLPLDGDPGGSALVTPHITQAAESGRQPLSAASWWTLRDLFSITSSISYSFGKLSVIVPSRRTSSIHLHDNFSTTVPVQELLACADSLLSVTFQAVCFPWVPVLVCTMTLRVYCREHTLTLLWSFCIDSNHLVSQQFTHQTKQMFLQARLDSAALLH